MSDLRRALSIIGFALKGPQNGVRQRASSLHIKFWDSLFISETNRASKLKFGTLVGIYEYYG